MTKEHNDNRLAALLNKATPYAATSEDEIQARMLAARLRTEQESRDGDLGDRFADPSQEKDDRWSSEGLHEPVSLPGGEDLYSDANLRPGQLEEPVLGTPSISDDTTEFTEETFDLQGDQEILAEALSPQLARAMLGFGELQECITINSSDHHVKVVINLAGRILSLDISEDGRRRIRVSQLARSVQEAVNTARDRSAQIAVEIATRNRSRSDEATMRQQTEFHGDERTPS